MNLRGVRITVRGLMAMVVVVGVAFGIVVIAVRTSKLVQSYQGSARESAEAERHNLRYAVDCDRKAAEARIRGETKLAEKYEREAELGRFWAPKHHQRVLTFERAVTHPWEPLPPGIQVLYREPPATAVELLARWLTTRGLPSLVIILTGLMCLAFILVRNLTSRPKVHSTSR
jgi:hypothetical protein